MNAAVRPIHLPGAAALDALGQRAQAALDVWASEWVRSRASGVQATAKVHPCSVTNGEARTGQEYEAVHTETGCIWFRYSAADQLSFGRAVVGAELMPRSTCADDWIAGIVDHARAARNRALCSALLGPPLCDALPPVLTALPASVFAFGSGAVQLTCDELALHAVADSAVWRGVPPMARDVAHCLPKVTSLEHAMRRATARLEVVLGSVEIELPALLGLCSGDVLRLPQRLDHGIAVLCEGKPLARAALGEAQGRKAVQMLAGPQPTLDRIPNAVLPER